MLCNFTNQILISNLNMDPKMNIKRLHDLSGIYVDSLCMYSPRVLHKIASVNPENIEFDTNDNRADFSFKELQSIPLSKNYGYLCLKNKQGNNEVFMPEGNVNYLKPGLKRDSKEYSKLHNMLKQAIFTVIDGLTFSSDKTKDSQVKDTFKTGLVDQKFTDLAIHAYIKFKDHSQQLELALIQILWLYIHDDLRDDSSSPLHTNADEVNGMNKGIYFYLRGTSRASFKFSNVENNVFDMDKVFKKHTKLIPKLTLLEGLTTEYKHRLDKMFSTTQDDARLQQLKVEMKNNILKDVDLYFKANHREAVAASQKKTTDLMSYQEYRKQNSAVPLCATLGETYLALNNPDPVYAWYQITQLHEEASYIDVHTDMALHIGAANCIFSAAREYINGDATNLVAIFKKPQNGPELTWPQAYSKAADYVNAKYDSLIESYNMLKEKLRKKTIAIYSSDRTVAEIEQDLDSLDPSSHHYKNQYIELVFQKQVKEYFETGDLNEKSIGEFLKLHPQIQNFKYMFDWTDGNIHFSTHAPRYLANDQRLNAEEVIEYLNTKSFFNVNFAKKVILAGIAAAGFSYLYGPSFIAAFTGSRYD